MSVFDSDTDEERQSDLSVWISISDRFLQEISREGTVRSLYYHWLIVILLLGSRSIGSPVLEIS